MTISQAFALYDHPSQMEPLLPAEHRLGPLLERAHDLELVRRALLRVNHPQAQGRRHGAGGPGGVPRLTLTGVTVDPHG